MPFNGADDENHLAFLDRSSPYYRRDILTAARQLADAMHTPTSAKNEQKALFMMPAERAEEVLVGLLAGFMSNQIVVPWRKVGIGKDYLPRLLDCDGEIAFDNKNPGESRVVWWKKSRSPRTSHRLPQQTNLVLTSSGSTGPPKGIAISKDNFVLNAKLAGQALKLDTRKLAAWAIDADLAFTSAICHILMAWIYRLPIHYADRNLGELISDTIPANIHYGYGGSPLSALRLIEQAKPNCRPKLVVTSGDFLRPAAIERMREASPETEINAFYGMSEFSGRICAITDQQLRQQPPYATGFPLPEFEIEIRNKKGQTLPAGEHGRVFIKSPLLMHAYIHDQDNYSTYKKDTFFDTGDTGYCSDNQCLYLTGRDADVFKVGGEQVNRINIENHLQDILKSKDFAVIGCSHELLGQIPVLVIEAGIHETLPTRAEIIRHIKQKLPAHCIPLKFYRLDEPLPRTLSGKLQTDVLRNKLHDNNQL